MAGASIGQIQEFHPESDSITAYLENNVAEEENGTLTTQRFWWQDVHTPMKFAGPTLPKDKTFDELVTTLKGHYEPKPVATTERFHLHKRKQAAGESISDYIAELRQLSTHCEFGTFLNQALLDQLIWGLRSESIQKKLLSQPDLTLTNALEVAKAMEVTDQNAKAIKGSATDAAIQNLTSSKQRSPCHRCGKTNHNEKDCRFRDANCNWCGKKGHIASVCRSRKAAQQAGGRRPEHHKGYKP